MQLIYGSHTVTLTGAPLRRAGDNSLGLRQARERDSSGAVYVYAANVVAVGTYPVTVAVSNAELDELLNFVSDTVQGVRRAFTWVDQDDVQRRVKLAETRMQSRRTGPDRHLVSFILEDA
jgi:hypothetical protein